MPGKYLALLRDAGLSYFLKRGSHQLQTRLGITRRKNNFKPTLQFPISKAQWLMQENFLFTADDLKTLPKQPNQLLEKKLSVLKSGSYTYFNGITLQLPPVKAWHTHPVTGTVYEEKTHWTRLNDFSKGEDIKWVWERARFCHLYTYIRYDHHFNSDHCSIVLDEICDWIGSNPLHCGPHYMSGQEVALRVLNWLFALHFYKLHPALTEEKWNTITCSLRDQIRHVHTNIRFAANLVRNNHLLTEAAALFTFSLVFPTLPECKKLRIKGWDHLVREALYQFLPDGSYIQYSMNYHRVALQIYTWALQLASQNGITIPQRMQLRLQDSVRFLMANTDQTNGSVPNYGANDGSLFFPLNDNPYTDFRPVVQAASAILGVPVYYDGPFEDSSWLTSGSQIKFSAQPSGIVVNLYQDGGYFTCSADRSFTFIRCGKNIFRPSQADQLHLDIRFDHQPLLFDGGTFAYNADAETTRYFFGTGSHNTISAGGMDQMLKGPRFIWYHWTQFLRADFRVEDDLIQFNGTIRAFRQSGKYRRHHRYVAICPSKNYWHITDTVTKPQEISMEQYWHVHPDFHTLWNITAHDINGNLIQPKVEPVFHSPTYGVKIPCERITFSTRSNQISTLISMK